MKKKKIKKRNPYVLPMILHCKPSKFQKKSLKRAKNKILKELEKLTYEI
jgi:hypothetical protein